MTFFFDFAHYFFKFVQDTVRYANKCEENLDMFGKIVCLLNNTFYRCDVSLNQDNEDGEEVTIFIFFLKIKETF